MKKDFAIVIGIVAIALLVLFMGYSQGWVNIPILQKHTNQHEHAEVEASSDDHDHNHEGVHLTEEQRKIIKLKIAKAQEGKIPQKLELHGETKLNADKTANVMQRIPGFVSKVEANQGDEIEKGAILAVLTSAHLGELFSNYNSALEFERVAKQELDMAETLNKVGNLSNKEYQRYKREYINETITRRKAEALLNAILKDQTVHSHKHLEENTGVICTTFDVIAPISGTIIEKNIYLGEKYADDNMQVLFKISDLNTLWLELQADNSELQKLKKGMSVAIKSMDGIQHKQGKIVYIASVIDESSRTGLVRVELDNTNLQLRSGVFVIGEITLDEQKLLVNIPQEAVQLIDGETVVFVPHKDAFITRMVKTGNSANGMIEILSGLKVDDPYVISGAFELKSMLVTAGMDPHAGHGH